jgi:outer membrane protein assembly factor BamD (BamD/ComL family)
MLKNAITAGFLAVLLQAAAGAETWRIGKDGSWRELGPGQEDRYVRAVARIKELVNNGDCPGAGEAVEQLKKDYPEIAAADFDAFIKAEMLFCAGRFEAAVAEYDKFLTDYPQSKLYQAAIDRQFAIATAYLSGRRKTVLKIFRIKSHAEGENIMNRIADRAGDSPISAKASEAVAASLEERGDFVEAYEKWSQINARWPTGPTGRDALLGMARCKHASYAGAGFDSSGLVSAGSYYEQFSRRYPREAENFKVGEKLETISEQTAYKQYTIGRYYDGNGDLQAANLYYRMVTEKWPGSTAAKMAAAAMKEQENRQERQEKWHEKITSKLGSLFL